MSASQKVQCMVLEGNKVNYPQLRRFIIFWWQYNLNQATYILK